MKEPAPGAKASLADKIIQTASQVADEKKSGKNERFGIAMVDEEGPQRLALLDAEKYGRAVQSAGRQGYSPSPRLFPADLQDQEKLGYVMKLSESLNGGLSVVLDADSLDLRGTYNMIAAASSSVPFFRVHRSVSFCRSCGSKLAPETGRCRKCRSTATTVYSTAD